MKILASDTPTSPAEHDNTLRIDNDADLGVLVAEGALQGIARIELVFPKFTDGRAFSQAVLLRRRHRFAGDIRATGDVLIDQLVQMQRSGFSSAVLAAGVNADAAQRQFERYAAYYQGDVLEPRPHFVREPARPSLDTSGSGVVGGASAPSEIHMRPPGCPKDEYRWAKPEGSPVSAHGRCDALVAEHAARGEGQ